MMMAWLIVFGIIGLILVLIIIASPCILSAVGFSAAGVVAESIAARVQSVIGNVAAGGVFAFLQSIGAVGRLPYPVLLLLILLGAIFVAMILSWFGQ